MHRPMPLPGAETNDAVKATIQRVQELESQLQVCLHRSYLHYDTLSLLPLPYADTQFPASIILLSNLT